MCERIKARLEPIFKLIKTKTEKGRKRCAIAKTMHGYETRAAREYRAKKFIEMKSLFDMLKKELI